jgi:hypothetical protein
MYRFLSRICAKFVTGYTLIPLLYYTIFKALPLLYHSSHHINHSSQFLSSFIDNAYICSYQLKINTMKTIDKWLSGFTQPTKTENTYRPRTKPAIQSTVDFGKGLSFNEKAEHIFSEIKKLNNLKS